MLRYYNDTGGVYEELAALPQPTIAAIHGYCLGGALELALALDFRIADESAVFGFPEVSLGILASSGGLHRVTRLLGPARAKELFLLAERFGADDARRAGVVTEVVEEGKALDRALEIAARLAALPRDAVAVTKQGADDTNSILRTEGGPQQPHRVEILQPLTIAHVGLTARHILYVASVHQTHSETVILQNLKQRNPEHARGLHGYALHPARLQPVSKAVQVIRES